MTVGRRKIFGLGVLGLGAVAAGACTGPFPGPGAAMGPLEIERLLRELDDVVVRLEALDPDTKRFGIRGQSPAIDAEKKRCIALLTTLCFVGTYRHVPESTWNEPRVAAHLERTLPRIRAVLSSAREQLVGMPDAQADAIDARFEAEPELPMRIMEQVDEYAKQIEVPLEQRTYLRLSTAELAARFRYEGTRAVTGKLASSYGRILDARLAELGVSDDVPDEAHRPLDLGASAKSSGSPAGQPLLGKSAIRPVGEAGESCVHENDCEEHLTCSDSVCVLESKSKLVKGTAGDMAIWGAIFLIPPLCAIGVLILLQALFVAIVSGAVAEET